MIDLRSLKDLLTYNKSLLLTFLLSINHAKALTIDGPLDFQMKLVGKGGLIIKGSRRIEKERLNKK